MDDWRRLRSRGLQRLSSKMNGIAHSSPYSDMTLRSQVTGRAMGMEELISGLWVLDGALNYYGMGTGLRNIATGSLTKVPTISGLRTVG
jgi:hypothetical protein